MIDRAFDFLRRNFPELSLGLCSVSVFKAARRRSSLKRRLIWSVWAVWSLQSALAGAKDRSHRRGMYR